MIHWVGKCRNEKVCIMKKKYMDRKLESRGRVERRTTILEGKKYHIEKEEGFEGEMWDEYVKEN